MTTAHSKRLLCFKNSGAPSVSDTKPPNGFESRFGLGLLLVSLFLFAGITHAQQTGAGPLREVTLQLKWHHHFQFAGYYAALEQGFFLEEGLNVSLLEGGPDVPVASIVASGEADFGVLGSELVLDRLQGQPFVLLAVIFQHSTRALIVREDREIYSPSDLVDQRFMLNIPESAEFWAMFEREGFPREGFDVIQKDRTAIDQLISGEIAAMNGSVGGQPFVLRQRNVPVRLIRPIDYGIDFYGDSLFTSEAFLEKHPDQVAAVRRATIRGWEYAMSHVDEVITLILSKYTTDIERDHLRFEAESMRTLILPELVACGHVNPGRIRRIAETYAELGLAPERFNLDGFLYDPEPPVDFRWVGWLVGVMFAVVALIGVWGATLYAFNRRLRKEVGTRTQELSGVNRELRESEEGARLMADLLMDSNQPVAVGYLDGRLGRLNPAFCTLTGYTEEELQAIDWSTELSPPEWASAEREVLAELERTGEPVRYEKEYIRKDGSRVPIELLVHLARDADGNPDYYYAFITDITERKQAENAIAESEEKYRALFNNAPLPYQSLNEDGCFLDINPAWLRILGYEREEVIGHWFGDFLHPDFAQHFETNFPAFKKRGYVKDVHFQIRHKNGSYRHIEFEGCIGYLPDGSFRQTYCVFQDITERKTAEEAIRQERDFSQSALDSLPGLFYLFDERGILLRVNKDFEQFSGYPAEELYRMNIQDFFDDTDWPRVAKEIQRVYQTGESTVEAGFLSKNQTKIPCFFTGKRFQHGDQTCLMGMGIDITERRRAEDAQRKSDEMMRNSQSVAHICSYSTDLNINEVGKSAWICSPEFYNIFGIDETYPHTIEGWADFIHPDFREELIAYHESVIKEKTTFDHEYKIIRINDGAERWVHGTGKLVFDQQGSPVRMHGAIQDITDRKMAEEKLAASEERFRTICERAPVLIDGFDEAGRCNLWNEQCCKTFGWTFEEISAHPNALELFYPDPDVRDEVLKSIAHHPDEQFREWQPRTKDGQMLTTVWANLLLPNGQVYSIGQDITENRRMEQELANHSADLEHEVDERTLELRQIVNAMAGRENRMAELKETVAALRGQLRDAGLEPKTANLGFDEEDAV